MSAYMIFIKEKTLDQKEFDIYSSKIMPTFEGYDVKVLAGYEPHDVLEGKAIEGVVILEFPSVEIARAWYDSPAYRAILDHRLKGAVYSGLITQGRADASAT